MDVTHQKRTKHWRKEEQHSKRETADQSKAAPCTTEWMMMTRMTTMTGWDDFPLNHSATTQTHRSVGHTRSYLKGLHYIGGYDYSGSSVNIRCFLNKDKDVEKKRAKRERLRLEFYKKLCRNSYIKGIDHTDR